MRRLLFTLLLLSFVAALGGWLLGAGSAAAGDADAASVDAAAAAVSTQGGEVQPADSSFQPCLLRADCAGGGLLVGAPLLLVVTVGVLVGVVLISLGRASTSVAALSPALLVARLDRPPQLSS